MNTRDGQVAEALSRAAYRKSTKSSGTGSCVAIGHAAGYVGIQDTKEGLDSARRTTLAFSSSAFARLIESVV